MCGIFGYVGTKKNAAQTVLEGLKLLEYRGYDSWGVAVKEKGGNKEQKTKFVVEKRTGKIADAKLNSKFLILNSSLALGHTRWATHGGVTDKNAHPHIDCTRKISIIHNGIIENYQELKKLLEKKHHKFLSDTDSEIIPHLIEEELKKFGFATSVRNAFNMLRGMNAIVAAYSISSEMVIAKTGSPLVIGENKKEFFVSSDATSILPHTKKMLFIKDNEMAIIGKNLQLINLGDGKKQKINFETINWKSQNLKKGKFPHFMIKEISEQPNIIRNIATTYQDQVSSLTKTIKTAKGTFFIGAGTASFAGLIGTYFFSKIANKHVNMAYASEFNYLLDFIKNKSLIIALSQSGETIDVVEPLTIAKKKKAKIATLTNTQGSTIYRMSDEKILLGAGIEQAVASTKAYIAKLSILLMLSYQLVNSSKTASEQLIESANEIEKIIKNKKKLKPVVELLAKNKHIYIIGRGVSYPTALEAALKIREVSYIHAEGLAGGELKHGTIALISKGTPCIVFAPLDETHDAILSNAIEIRSRGGIIIGVSNKNHPAFDYFIEVKNTSDATALSQIVPLQLIAYELALKKGYDPDKPRNLAKSVTVK